MTAEPADRTVLVDASALLTLAGVGRMDLLWDLRGEPFVPTAVANEVRSEPAASRLNAAEGRGDVSIGDSGGRIRPQDDEDTFAVYQEAGAHLGKDLRKVELSGEVSARIEGDTALLSLCLALANPVLVSDDKPLRNVCKALSVPVSGSIGALIRAVERGDLSAEAGRNSLHAMDAVGARLSASLIRRAERLIEEAADE